jgi:alpha-beta hydrolase superfamily lysophospholipase
MREQRRQTGERVATYTDPVTRTREDATFTAADGSEIFCVVHRPAGTPRAGVVFCPPIFTEEHKIYGTQVLSARACAASGFAAIRFHYRGTGHSGGVFADATVDTMLADVSTAIAHLERETGASSLAFVGGRWGGLIAGIAACARPGAPVIFWEPALDGPAYFRDVFRASQLSALAGGASALTVTQAVQRLMTDGVLDALGYPVHRALYESASGRSLAALAAAGPRPVLIVQISRQQQLKAEFARLKEALTGAGLTVDTALIEGEGAWSFVDSPMPSPDKIVEVSRAWLTGAARAA